MQEGYLILKSFLKSTNTPLLRSGAFISRYLEAKGLTERDVTQGSKLYGENSVDVQPPSFWQHLAERLTSPFVVFSLFNQVRHCLLFP